MISVNGKFALYRTKTTDGKDAILLVPEPGEAPLTFTWEDGSLAEITFERVDRPQADAYLTLADLNSDFKVHLGPYVEEGKVQ